MGCERSESESPANAAAGARNAARTKQLVANVIFMVFLFVVGEGSFQYLRNSTRHLFAGIRTMKNRAVARFEPPDTGKRLRAECLLSAAAVRRTPQDSAQQRQWAATQPDLRCRADRCLRVDRRLGRRDRSIVRREHVAPLGHQVADGFGEARIWGLADEWFHGPPARWRLAATRCRPEACARPGRLSVRWETKWSAVGATW